MLVTVTVATLPPTVLVTTYSVAEGSSEGRGECEAEMRVVRESEGDEVELVGAERERESDEV